MITHEENAIMYLNEPARQTAARRVAAVGAWQATDAVNRRFPGESAATDLLGSVQRQGLAKSV